MQLPSQNLVNKSTFKLVSLFVRLYPSDAILDKSGIDDRSVDRYAIVIIATPLFFNCAAATVGSFAPTL